MTLANMRAQGAASTRHTKKTVQPMRILERKDIVKLLWIEVEKAGSQTAWTKNNGIDRSHVNKVLHYAKPPTDKIIHALGLRTVIISD